MKLNNKKIDLLVKLVMFMFPWLYCLFIAISTESTTLTSFEQVLVNIFQGMQLGIFENFAIWFSDNITSSGLVVLMLFYAFYLVFVEFIILFKNCLVWLFKVANDFIERGVGK